MWLVLRDYDGILQNYDPKKNCFVFPQQNWTELNKFLKILFWHTTSQSKAKRKQQTPRVKIYNNIKKSTEHEPIRTEQNGLNNMRPTTTTAERNANAGDGTSGWCYIDFLSCCCCYTHFYKRNGIPTVVNIGGWTLDLTWWLLTSIDFHVQEDKINRLQNILRFFLRMIVRNKF